MLSKKARCEGWLGDLGLTQHPFVHTAETIFASFEDLDVNSSDSCAEVSSNVVTGDCEDSEGAACWDSDGEFSAL